MSEEPNKKRQLEDKIENLLKEVKEKGTIYSQLRDDIFEKKKTLRELQAEYWKLDHTAEFEISDHALVRYMERFKGIDTKKIYEDIYYAIVNFVPNFSKDGDYDCGGFTARVKNRTVVTIIY